MSSVRIALANLPIPATAQESVSLAVHAIEQAAALRADIVCFPEAYIPGYRAVGKRVPPPDPVFLEGAWAAVAAAAARAKIAVVLGTERVVDGATRLTALVLDRDGTVAGFQDKVQLDPSEEGTYSAGTSAVVRPDGTLLGYQPYGRAGVFVADIELAHATGLLASRCRTA